MKLSTLASSSGMSGYTSIYVLGKKSVRNAKYHLERVS